MVIVHLTCQPFYSFIQCYDSSFNMYCFLLFPGRTDPGSNPVGPFGILLYKGKWCIRVTCCKKQFSETSLYIISLLPVTGSMSFPYPMHLCYGCDATMPGELVWKSNQDWSNPDPNCRLYSLTTLQLKVFC